MPQSESVRDRSRRDRSRTDHEQITNMSQSEIVSHMEKRNSGYAPLHTARLPQQAYTDLSHVLSMRHSPLYLDRACGPPFFWLPAPAAPVFHPRVFAWPVCRPASRTQPPWLGGVPAAQPPPAATAPPAPQVFFSVGPTVSQRS
eukprot:gene10221-biopygen13833